MPTAKHALCLWMIVAKFPSWFNAVLGERYNDWKAEFYRLYNLESIEDFEMGWRDMVNSFGLHTNRHIVNLYGLRSLWALPFLRSHFFAGITTIGQSKSINAFIQRFLSAQTRLAQFVEQVCCSPTLFFCLFYCCFYFFNIGKCCSYVCTHCVTWWALMMNLGEVFAFINLWGPFWLCFSCSFLCFSVYLRLIWIVMEALSTDLISFFWIPLLLNHVKPWIWCFFVCVRVRACACDHHAPKFNQ